MARRRRRNPGGVWGFASSHPWLFTLFVVPSIAGVAIALVRAVRPAPALPPAAPTPPPFNPATNDIYR